ncbi:MAG: ABC transporter permease subunit [Clostridia bacterium]|nr:ABC transporter permease subunit [Clostridia bacterium]
MNGLFSPALLGYNLKARMRNFIIWSVISLCLFILIIVMFTNLLNAGLPDLLADMLASFPTAGGADKSVLLPDFKDFGVNIGVCLQIMLIVGCIYASYLGASANTGGRGDITFIYSLPVTRVCTVLTSFFAQIVTLFFYNIIVFLVSLGVLYSNNKMSYLGKIILAVIGFLLVELVYLSIAFLLSTFMNNSSQASSISAVVVTVTVLFGLIGSLARSLRLLKALSPYTYVSVYAIVSGSDRMFYVGIAAGLLITIISLVLSCIRYEKIDFLLD